MAPDALPDPFVFRCPGCRRTGGADEWMTHPRQGYRVCPQCWRLGYESMPERIPLSRVRPTGEEP
jgi:recombinational DNA repair protein (RecF pathway)